MVRKDFEKIWKEFEKDSQRFQKWKSVALPKEEKKKQFPQPHEQDLMIKIMEI